MMGAVRDHLVRWPLTQQQVDKKKYDLPRTPFDRVMASEHVSDEAKEHLKIVHSALNPFILKKNIEKKLRVIVTIFLPDLGFLL